MSGRYAYALSATGIAGSFVYLFSVPVPAPLNLYVPALKIQTLADGGARYEGAPVNTWYYASLDAVERAFFRIYCPGLVADDVYIQTLNGENTWVTARTKMLWSPQEKFENDCTLGFTLTFKIKSAVTFPPEPS